MKCYNCGNEFSSLNGSLELPSNVLGSYSIDNVNYFKCLQCQEIFLSDEAWNLADEKENKLIADFVSNLAFKKFIGASKAASILEMSRQALHKHRRIRRGFIYSIILERKRYYHIESVKLFKETGDGRFPLRRKVQKKEKKYIFVTIPYSLKQNRFQDFGGRKEIIGWSSAFSAQPTLSGHSYD